MSESAKKTSLRDGFADLSARAEPRSLSEDSYALLLKRLAARSKHRPRWRWPVLALATSLALGIGLWRFEHVATVAGFRLAESARNFAWHGDDESGLQVVAGEAILAAPELRARVQVQTGTHLRKEGRAIRMFVGRANFDVDPRHEPDAVRVLVSGGVIEVLGTQFLVEQGRDGGAVWLYRGRIRFVADSGAVRVLAVGQSLHWPLLEEIPTPAPVPASAPVPSPAEFPARSSPRTLKIASTKPASRAELAPAPAADPVRAYLTEIDALRIRHEYPALAQRLAEVIKSGVREPMRESLSLELCDVLVRHIHDRARACAYVAEHLGRYPEGSSTGDLKQSASRLRCPP